MKMTPICLLTVCKHRKFKLFEDSSQVHTLDNGITCCYWSAAFLESAQFLIQMLWKELSKLYVLYKRKTSCFLSLGIFSIICVIEIDFCCPF